MDWQNVDYGKHRSSDSVAEPCNASCSSDQQGADLEEDDGIELSALEYARLHGLCKDYLLDDVFETCVSSMLNSHACLNEAPPDHFMLPILSDLLQPERIGITREALLLLQDVMRPQDNYDVLQALPARPLKQSLRVELPLLRTDHELDVRSFGKRPDPQLHVQAYPLEYVDVEEDEGLEWPDKYHALSKEKLGLIERAKLECSREAIEYLHEVSRGNENSADGDLSDLYVEANRTGQKKRRAELITPPLLPLSSPKNTTFDPSSDTAQIPLPSESSDSLAAEVSEFRMNLHEYEKIPPLSSDASGLQFLDEDHSLAKLYPPMLSDLALDISSTSQRRLRDELLIEVPLVLGQDSSSPHEKKLKALDVIDDLHSIIPSLPEVLTFPRLEDESEASFQAFYSEVIKPRAERARKILENEQLQAADSLQRVEVPVMDFIKPMPPWKAHSRTTREQKNGMAELDTQRQLLNETRATLEAHGTVVWGGVSNAARRLPWCPFPPELAKLDHEHGIDDSRYIAVLVGDLSPEDVVVSDDLVWKPEGLRVLREAEEFDDEDFEVPIQGDEDSEVVNDSSIIPRKRKRDNRLVESINQKIPIAKTRNFATIAPDFTSKLGAKPLSTSTPSPNECNSDWKAKFFGSHFQTSTALANLMGACGKANERPREQGVRISQIIPSHRAQPIAEDTELEVPLQSVGNGTQLQKPFGLPSLPTNGEKKSYILSSHLLQSERMLLKAIYRLVPNALLIERDFAGIPSAPEADIILSPATGLILTSIQKIKQRTIPGSKMKLNGIQRRVFDLAWRYERLVIIVRDALSLDLGSDSRDSEALADFSSYCLSYEVEIQILLAPIGETATSHWVVMCMHQFSVCYPHLELLQDETMWEIFLRRCGFNAFAAQAILISLSKTPQDSSRPDAILGIRDFVCMEPEARASRFERLLGGRLVLARVNSVLERGWLSARTGFREP